MYSSSKINYKNLALSVILALAILLPLRKGLSNIFIFLSEKLLFIPQNYSNYVETIQSKKLKLLLRVRKLSALQEENEKLKKALNFNADKAVNIKGVEIVAFDPSNWRRVVIVNAGENDGLKKGLYAIDESGFLVGKIVETRKNYSRLMLIDDPDFNIPVFVGETAFGLLRGSLEGIKVIYVENKDDVRVNDKVWCKISFFSFPVYIGEVRRLKRERNNLFLDIDVRLLSTNPYLHKIFIIH